MNYIENANLPEKKVKTVIAGGLSEETQKSLNKYGVEVIKIRTANTVDSRISSHADLVFLSLGGDNSAIAKEADYLTQTSPINGMNIIKSDILLSDKYPYDCPLNCVIIGKYMICNVDTARKDVLEYCRRNSFEILNVKQGYTKCSVVPVSENAVITDDISIYKGCKDRLDVLFVDKGFVRLDGFEYGFIGGSAGKLGRNLLAFTGRIYDDLIRNKIENFCLLHNVQCVYLSDEKIYDVGSIIPITEE